MKKETKLLSIVFSFRNEEENLKELIQRVNKIKREIPNWNIEMIFVNDYSNDNSLNILKEEKKVNNIKIPYILTERRPGDVARVVANNKLATELLNWVPNLTLEEMCRDGWKWICQNPNGY